MVHGENRAKIKEGVKDFGRGLRDFTTGTADAIVHPSTIPEKIDTFVERGIVKPTKRIVDFVDSSKHRVLADVDRGFNERVKQAQDGAKHLKVVFAQPMGDVMGSYHAKSYPKGEDDKVLIDAALKENVVFAGLSSSKRCRLIDAFEDICVKPNTKIINQGDEGDFFYIIAEGEVDFQIDGKVVGTAKKGGSFGGLALLYQAPRAATCIAKTQCGLFRLDQMTFKRAMAQQMKDSHSEVIGVLRKVPYFKGLDVEYLDKISSNLRTVRYNDGDVLSSNDMDTPPTFCIIKKGVVECVGINAGGSEYGDLSLHAGQFYGDYSIANNKRPSRVIKAKGKVEVLELDRIQFVRVLGDDLELLIRKTVDKKKLKMIPFGQRKGPAENELDLLANAIKEKKYPKGHVFLTEGTRTQPALYLIRKGKVSIRSSNHPNLESVLGFDLGTKDSKAIGKDGYFGNDTLGANETGEFGLAVYTVTALEEVEAGVLDLHAIKRLAKTKKDKAKKTSMEDLDMIRILGAGTFGKVWLVTDKRAGGAYAMKIQVKKQLIEYNQAEGVIREKNIMELLDHPFIIKMVSSWKDDEKLYMLLKLYQGGELQSVIHTDTRDGIPEWAAVFYSANILEGLSHMHRRNIIYRDLKPENVLLDSEGYTVIVDLGFAKIIKNKTYTFCGTPLYLAPEIIMQKGHDKGADHWSWGVLLYEMIVGMTPFYDGIVDQMGLFKNIVKGKMDFPSSFMSAESIDLIKCILTVNPNNRLGSFARAEKDIKEHKFFKDIDWKKLSSKKMKVPFKPKVSDPLDGSNFDDYSKLEAQAKKEKTTKLTAAEQKLFSKF